MELKKDFYIYQMFVVLLYAMSKYKNEVFKLGSGNPQSIITLAKMIYKNIFTLRPGEPKTDKYKQNKKIFKMVS